MPKRIVRYKLEGDGSVPKWIDSGGFLPLGHEMVGLTVDDDQFYVPSDVDDISDEELQLRLGEGDLQAFKDMICG